jgi:predicted nucleotidyltransferase
MKEVEFKVLSSFYPNISVELNPKTVSKMANLSYGGAYQTLLALSKMKVLIRNRIGNYNVYRINPESDLAKGYLLSLSVQKKAELYSIFKLEGEAIGRLICRINEKLGPKFHCAVLFGSFAKGEIKRESDIDILFIVGYEIEIKESTELISDLCNTKSIEAGRQINPVIVSISEFNKMLQNPKRNLAHEVFVSGIPAHGAENYIEMVMEWIRWKGKSI